MKTRYLAELVVAVLLITGGIITPARAAAGTQDGALVGVSRPVAAPGGSNSWSWRGPQFNSQVGEAPEVIQVVFDVVNSNTIWATTNQGVYLSQDGGESWEPRNRGLSGYGDLVVTDLLQDPSDPGQLTISTWGYGLFHSADGGAQWTRLTDPLGATSQATGARLKAGSLPEPPPVRAGGHSYSLEVNQAGPVSGKKPIAGVAPARLPRPGPAAANGAPQSPAWTPVRRVVADPHAPNQLFAAIDDGHGIYHSLDGGSTWSQLHVGSGSGHSYTFAPSSSRIRYTSLDGSTASSGLYRSVDDGANWALVGSEQITATVSAVAIHPTDPHIVLAATLGAGLFRSADGGNSWTLVSGPLADDVFFSVAFAPSDPSILYAGAYNWVYVSEDGGLSWTNADQSFSTGYVEGLAIHPTVPNTVLFGAESFPHGGVYKRTQSTATFALKAAGMTDTFVLNIAQDPANSNILWAATWGGGVFKSENGGVSWGGPSGFPYVSAVTPAVGTAGTVLYAATFYDDVGVLKSNDGGASWSEISHGYASDISFDIEVVDGDPDRLLAATQAGVQTSVDGGASWQAAEGLNSGIVLGLCHFPGTDRFLAATYGGGIFYSAGGLHWYEANDGISGTDAQYTDAVACSPDVTGSAYAGSLGIFRSDDFGEHWYGDKAGLPQDYFRALAIVPGSDDVFAGSYQNGVYLAGRGSHFWSTINSGLTEQRVRALKVVGGSPVRVFAGSNGKGSWEYNPTLRPSTYDAYLPYAARGLAGPFPATDLYEPNDDKLQAYALPGSGTYYAYMSPAGDVDWYRVNVSSLGQLSIDLDNIPVDSDFDLYLFNSSGVSVDMSTLSGDRAERIVFQPATTGTLYVAVVDWLGGSSTQPYRLTVSLGGAVGAGQIYGTAWPKGLRADFVPLQLCADNGYRVSCISTTTDSSGVYYFRGMPALPTGQEYFVNYPNYEGSADRLLAFQCRPIENYQAGQTIQSCTFDLADVTAVSPPSESTQSLPTTFTWNTRNLAGDDYVLRLRDLTTGQQWTSPHLGNVSDYALTALPAGFSTGQEYAWDVLVYTSQGVGTPYYPSTITFSTSNAASSAGVGKPERNRPAAAQAPALPALIR